MQFTRGIRVDKFQKEKKTANQLVSLYTDAPQEELTLDEFELSALDRLQLLRGIEIIQARGYDGKEFTDRLTALEKKHMPLKNSGETSIVDKSGRTADQRKDQISHFILRLAYCRSDELRNWFCKYECALLKFRLDKMSEGERSQFMAANGLEYDLVGADDKLALRDRLMGLCNINKEGDYAGALYYKIPFQQALPMIASRSVYLERGYAYVPLQRLVSIIVTRYRIHLSKALTEASSMFDNVATDSRIGPLLKNMNKQYVGRDFNKSSQATDKLTPDKVDAVADNHMPLCMKNLHMSLKRDHKIKHWGRLQYGLFLKGAGLGADDAQVFWEGHFSKIMNHEAFQKGYSYTFRHMYGKEGSRKNYTPFSCMKIIMGAPPEAGAYHGCPFRHQPDNQLSALLGSLKVGGPEVIREIVTLAKTSNYQLACQKHFDVTHPGHNQMDIKASDGVANHPNQWFQASVQYHKIKNGGAAATATATASAVTSTSASFSATASATATSSATGAGAGGEVVAATGGSSSSSGSGSDSGSQPQSAPQSAAAVPEPVVSSSAAGLVAPQPQPQPQPPQEAVAEAVVEMAVA